MADAHAALRFAVAGGRTTLLRQHVGYPYHITRPFYLDRFRPDLATLYLQSASGGLYRGEELNLALDLGAGAAAAVTTQSATIVHDCQGAPATQSTRLSLEPGAVLVYAPDPLVLFPGAAIRSVLHVTLAHGAAGVCQDGFACHDPAGRSRPFECLTSETVVRQADGRILLTDRASVDGASLGGPASPLGPHRASGSVLLLGRALTGASALQARIAAAGCLVGISALPNCCGTAIRILAGDGGRLRAALAIALAACFRAATGVDATPWRK